MILRNRLTGGGTSGSGGSSGGSSSGGSVGTMGGDGSSPGSYGSYDDPRQFHDNADTKVSTDDLNPNNDISNSGSTGVRDTAAKVKEQVAENKQKKQNNSNMSGSYGVRDQLADVSDGADESTGVINPNAITTSMLEKAKQGKLNFDPNAVIAGTSKQLDGDSGSTPSNDVTDVDMGQNPINKAKEELKEGTAEWSPLKLLAGVGVVLALVAGVLGGS